MVYRGMDIGTAKPGAETLAVAPHRLIDIREPEDAYSAGDFVRDAQREIDDIQEAGCVPLLVGGTMMYFRALTRGIAELPAADETIRAAIDTDAARKGWPAMHRELARVDPDSAARIEPNDSQRIQRALEVYRSSGRPLSEWQRDTQPPRPSLRYLKIAVIPGDRQVLHERIARRLDLMMQQGFVDEVRWLRQRPDLSLRSPAMRSVGYRQIWEGIDGAYDLDEAARRALFATRQLAKRQHTWLRAEPDLAVFDPLEDGVFAAISGYLRDQITE